MKLFSKYNLGKLQLKNRVVMAPLTRSRATEANVPTDIMSIYYGQRAGAGLIITEGTSPSINGTGYPSIPGLYNKAQVEAWKNVTQTVHDKGSLIFTQIMHTGRISHPYNLVEGARIVAPSAVAVTQTKMFTRQAGDQAIPLAEEMSKQDIQDAIEEYVNAAKNAITAGFDGIELHAANGYLIEQFLSPVTNKRTDEYGGSTQNRIRFAVEVAEKVVQAIGAEHVGIRLSPYGVLGDMLPYPEATQTYTELAKELNRIGLLYVHVLDLSPLGMPPVPQEVKTQIRKEFKGTLILSGGYDKVKAEAAIAAGQADLIAFGRPFISNPNLVEKLQKDLELVQPDSSTFYTPGPKGYIDYV